MREEVNTMKYETPELTALTPAISAIQGNGNKAIPNHKDSPTTKEETQAFADFE
jgi:hypothetical protein